MKIALLCAMLALLSSCSAAVPSVRTVPAIQTGRCVSCARDAGGRIARSSSARHRFMVASGHPHGWPGHVIDHVIALDCGGKDDPSNTQWQTIAEAKAKDRWERRGCE